MKKFFLFSLSISLALGITMYIKNKEIHYLSLKDREWKTFVKKSDNKIIGYKTTDDEFVRANIRASDDRKKSRQPSSFTPHKGFMFRDNRILMGEVDEKYEDMSIDLLMVNQVNPNWKEVLGHDLMRFQPAETKLMVKEELPVIRIEEGKGRFLEQVVVTYLKRNGDKNSFKALVDSETGSVVETWDRTIHERLRKKRAGIILPSINESGITTR